MRNVSNDTKFFDKLSDDADEYIGRIRIKSELKTQKDLFNKISDDLNDMQETFRCVRFTWGFNRR